MCGVAGYIGKNFIPDNSVAECKDLMARRGPDSSDFRRCQFDGKHVLLIHSRLSILDLSSRSDQPFTDDNKTLVFNGELYNFKEMRDKYSLNCSTTGDTEVLFKLLTERGVSVLEECEGMWGFAFYEHTSRRLILSRDRFAEKPLYYFEDENGLYFGSEVKFIFKLLGRTLKPNFRHLKRFMVNGYKSLYKTSDSFFEGLKEVRPGHCLEVRGNLQTEEYPYWSYRISHDESMTYKQAVEGTRDRMIESVRLRLRSDVPLAFCLSGGIDSNSIICIAKKILNYDVHGFTIMNSDSRYEEMDMINESIDKVGIHSIKVNFDTGSFLENLQILTDYHDGPVYTLSAYAHWLLMRSVSEQGYKVAVAGVGADELFSGYYDHNQLYMAEIKDDEELLEETVRNWQRDIAPIVRNPFLQDWQYFIKTPQSRSHIYLKRELFSQMLKRSFDEPFYESRFCEGLLRRRMLNEMFYEAVPVIQHQEDLNAMYFSIENRSPFLDAELFNFALSIPTRHLIKNGATKSVLRESMRGIVPDKILDNRRKVGFNAPLFSLLDRKDKNVKEFILDESPIFDLVKREAIEELFSKDFLPNSESKFLFYFINVKMFLEKFL